ncbi:hypothetical protein GE09DRAFT_475348 [Coniochaeta sp. 2T2.1]|nr:hypothetical protein GE09DRAFT_475348 [Coniochaeta sp. 2T2.1]
MKSYHFLPPPGYGSRSRQCRRRVTDDSRAHQRAKTGEQTTLLLRRSSHDNQLRMASATLANIAMSRNLRTLIFDLDCHTRHAQAVVHIGHLLHSRVAWREFHQSGLAEGCRWRLEAPSVVSNPNADLPTTFIQSATRRTERQDAGKKQVRSIFDCLQALAPLHCLAMYSVVQTPSRTSRSKKGERSAEQKQSPSFRLQALSHLPLSNDVPSADSRERIRALRLSRAYVRFFRASNMRLIHKVATQPATASIVWPEEGSQAVLG